MLKVVAQDFIKLEAVEIVLPLYRELVEKTRQEEFCTAYDLFINQKDPGHFIFIEAWPDREALDAHCRTEHFTRLVPLINAHQRQDGTFILMSLRSLYAPSNRLAAFRMIRSNSAFTALTRSSGGRCETIQIGSGGKGWTESRCRPSARKQGRTPMPIRSLLPRITTPTTILSGQHDGATPPDLSAEIAAAIHGSRLVEAPGAAHHLPIENPHIVTAAISGE